MIIRQLRFSGVNKLPVYEENKLLKQTVSNYYEWVSVTLRQIAGWYFPIVQISIDISGDY